MILSPRLQEIANLIKPCRCIADIGTDHAYLPVWLCLNGRCDTAIAGDINQGPLERAAATVERFHLGDRISLRLGSGVEPLAPKEADTIVIAGMGGLLIGELLKARPEVFAGAKQVLLQPMSSIPELREALYQMGYTICQEILVPEEEKLYHILSVEKKPETNSRTTVDFVLGRELCDARPPYFLEYLLREKARLTKKLAGLKQGNITEGTVWEETEALLKEVEKLMMEEIL